MLYQLSYSHHKVVGEEGFEPPTSCSQSRRATRLRYTPTLTLTVKPARQDPVHIDMQTGRHSTWKRKVGQFTRFVLFLNNIF